MTVSASLAVSRQSLFFLLPEILLIAVATVMVTAGAFVNKPRRFWSTAAALGLAAALVALGATLYALPADTPDPYAAVVSNDALSACARFAFLVTGLILLALAHDQVSDDRAPEFFGALLLIQAGAMIVASANELVLLFVGLELVSIPTYLLLYLPRRNQATRESALKYFYLSIFSSAFLLFGLAYVYGLAGLGNLRALAYAVHWPDGGEALRLPQPLFATVALVFVMAGLGFRVAAVPFHFYAPDVYQGSPTIMAALLSWVPKAIGFLAMLRVLAAVFGSEFDPGRVSNLAQISSNAVVLAAILAVATMTLGNTLALAQDDLKRLLAYSSIAHAGYLLVGLAAAFRNAAGGTEAILGSGAILFYLATYALMTLGTFGVILALGTPERPVEKIDDLSGLMRTNPWAAGALTICLFSLAGIPPLAGFWAKFFVFQSALETARGGDAATFQWLAVLGVLNAAIGAYYYLRIIVIMIFREPIERLRPRSGWPTVAAVAVCSSLTLLIGLFPAPLASYARTAGQAVVALPDPEPSPSAGPPIRTLVSRGGVLE